MKTSINSKKIVLTAMMLSVLAGFAVSSNSVYAYQTNFNSNAQQNGSQWNQSNNRAMQSYQNYGAVRSNRTYSYGDTNFSDASSMITYLQELIQQLQSRLNSLHSSGSYQAELSVTTLAADDIDVDEATLNGEVDLDDTDEATVWFVYGETRQLTETSDDETLTDDDDFSVTIDDLDEDTTYYYRAVAEDEDGNTAYGLIRTFRTDDDGNDDIPEVDTDSATNIDEDSAKIRGEVDMNDYRNGIVFFVYGEDEDQIEDVDNDYDSYSDVDEDGDDLQKVRVDNDLDSADSYAYTVTGLDEDTDYYFTIVVEYEDEDGDQVLMRGDVESFTTDED